MRAAKVAKAPQRCLCQYRNVGRDVRVVRAAEETRYIEKAVFPQQYFLFWASRDTTLEVYSGTSANLLLEDRIPCSRLEVGVERNSL